MSKPRLKSRKRSKRRRHAALTDSQRVSLSLAEMKAYESRMARADRYMAMILCCIEGEPYFAADTVHNRCDHWELQELAALNARSRVPVYVLPTASPSCSLCPSADCRECAAYEAVKLMSYADRT